MVSDKTFSSKLAAFILNTKTDKVRCEKKGGFTDSSPEVLGVLPFLHLNITKKDFTKIMSSCEGNMHKATNIVCTKASLDKVLKSVDFNCNKQSKLAASMLLDRMIETIETGYESRKQGKTRAREMAAHMRWQCANKIIPASSIAWCKGMQSASKVAPK
jgi:hypothetical protein